MIINLMGIFFNLFFIRPPFVKTRLTIFDSGTQRFAHCVYIDSLVLFHILFSFFLFYIFGLVQNTDDEFLSRFLCPVS